MVEEKNRTVDGWQSVVCRKFGKWSREWRCTNFNLFRQREHRRLILQDIPILTGHSMSESQHVERFLPVDSDWLSSRIHDLTSHPDSDSPPWLVHLTTPTTQRFHVDCSYGLWWVLHYAYQDRKRMIVHWSTWSQLEIVLRPNITLSMDFSFECHTADSEAAVINNLNLQHTSLCRGSQGSERAS